ncbi:MAG: 4-phosphoerythronate dehydrogenase [Verrucomicrobiae bacterium]|nr:4-phosphoerythronate dehydrogenase [Verrucomicrobiae bacterium]
MIRTVCTEDLPCAREAFSTLGEVCIRPGGTLAPSDLTDADLLAVRSGTRVDASLLAGSRVKFVGTATIGYDHLDTAGLDRAGIRWASAPGCNANSVADWFCAALFTLARRHGFRLAGKTLGLVGHGNVGARVAARAVALGLRVLLNDPPRARAARDAAYLPLREVLGASDIVTLHVPLEKEGAEPTFHLAGAGFFAMMKPGAIFVNAARGAVVDTDALLDAMDRGLVRHAVMDTWEGEPVYRTDLLRRAALGTAHIAGHSYEGKVMGTAMVYREACRFLGVVPQWSSDAHLAEDLPGHPKRVLDLAPSAEIETVVGDAVLAAYNLGDDDAALRRTLSLDDAARAQAFRALRKAYPVRREFRWHTLNCPGISPETRRVLLGLGFRVDGPPQGNKARGASL